MPACKRYILSKIVDSWLPFKNSDDQVAVAGVSHLAGVSQSVFVTVWGFPVCQLSHWAHRHWSSCPGPRQQLSNFSLDQISTLMETSDITWPKYCPYRWRSWGLEMEGSCLKSHSKLVASMGKEPRIFLCELPVADSPSYIACQGGPGPPRTHRL